MKKPILSWASTLLLILLGITQHAFAAKCGETISTVKSGNFSDRTIWDKGRVPSSCEKIVVNHAVNINQEVWVGKDGQGELLINKNGSLKGSGKLLVINNKSAVTVNGALEVTNFDFGINGNDSAYFVNNGTVKVQGNVFFKKGSVVNNGDMALTLGSPEALERITLRNNKNIVFSNSVHFNAGATVHNRGYFEVKATADDALNINTGYFYNCGEVKIAGRLNFPSGISLEKPNLLLNLGTVSADRVYMNHKATIKNWGRLYVKNNFESTQGVVINYACAYIEQSTAGKLFHNWNDKAELINDGFIKIKGDFRNTHGTVKGSGTFHVYGESMNTDQGVISGALCFVDFTKASANLVVDVLRNQASIAATVKACANATEPALCPLPGCEDDGGDDGNNGGEECVAVDECFEFIFKGTVTLPNGNVKLVFEIITNCDHDLSYAAFELPNGAKAKNPNASNYKYALENTTNNPFNSVKFEGKGIDGYKNGKSDTFSYELTAAEFAKLTTIRVQAKAAGTVGTVTFNAEGCDGGGEEPCPTEALNFSIVAPDTVCNLSDDTYRFEVSQVQDGVEYEFQLPEGFIPVDEGNGFVEVVAIFEEEQLGQPQTITVIARNECGERTETAQVVVIECSPGNPLPVSMTRFDGASRNGAIELVWTTATEINNDRFEIERSYDGKVFTKVGEVKGNGNSTVTIDYAFTDRQANQGTVYYRLRQVDFDGAFEHSKVIAVSHSGNATAGGATGMSVYPNPVTTGQVNIRFADAPQGDIVVRLVDLSGRVLHARTVGGSPEVAMELQSLGLAKGIYMISVTNGGKTETQRLMIR